MRKIQIIAAISFLLSACINVTAQDSRKYHFGLQVAPGLGWIKPEIPDDVYKSDGTVLGISYGGVFENYFIDNIGIGTGINVTYTGGTLKYNHAQDVVINNTTTRDTGILVRKYKLQYLEIPLVLIGSTGEILGNFAFFGKFGLGTGFNIKARANDEFTPDGSSDKITTENRDVKKDVGFFRESMIIGVGASYKIAPSARLFAGFTFNNGITDILTGTNDVKTNIKEKGRSNFVELNVGVLF